jgi:protein involved in polysaccharide export with SLBB domain
MSGIQQTRRGRRAANIALFLFLAVGVSVLLPRTIRALGGPWPITVSAEGEVRNPGVYTLPHNATLSALILAAGGFTDNADLRGAALARHSARAAQEAELRKEVERLAAETGGSAAAAEAVRPVVALLQGLRPAGRVTVRAAHPRLLRKSPADLPLENGDTLRIPPKVDSVAIMGAVRAASDNVPFSPGLPLKEYVRRAGGYADDAETDRVFLLRTDGTTALLTPGFLSWNPAASRWEVTALASGPPAIGPGDTIVVPRSPAPGLPSKTARSVHKVLIRASEIADAPVVLPGLPASAPAGPSSPP